MLETIRMIYVIQVFRRKKLSSLTDKVYTWDALLKFQKFWKINKYHGIIIRKIKDGKWSETANFLHFFPSNLCPNGESKWKKFCVAYNFNWLINLLSFSPLRRSCSRFMLHETVIFLLRLYKSHRRRRPTATRWNIVRQNILIQPNVVSSWFQWMKAMLDDMIAIWVARYCVVTASQSMLIGKRWYTGFCHSLNVVFTFSWWGRCWRCMEVWL